ncbi:tail fiber assembly protein [Lelliottia amnigena]|nr:tail fiber assembly protein [Lelliottia amnigena]
MTGITFDEHGLAQVAGSVIVYCYDGETGEYAGESDEYLAIGVGIPADSTVIPSPVAESGYSAVFRDGGWSMLPDHRGEIVYSTVNGEVVTITELGDYPANTTLLKPVTPYDKWTADAWVTDVTAQQSAQVADATQQKAMLLANASAVIAPLQDAKEGGYIDDTDIPVLTAWQKYRYALTKVDTANPEWPVAPNA